MAAAVTDFVEGLYSFLTSDSAFNTSIGGNASTAGRLRYGVAREQDTLPYVVFFLVNTTPFDTFNWFGFESLVQFTIYDDESNGADSVVDILDDLLDRLHSRLGSQIAIANMQAITPSFDSLRGPFREEETWRVDADFTILCHQPAVAV